MVGITTDKLSELQSNQQYKYLEEVVYNFIDTCKTLNPNDINEMFDYLPKVVILTHFWQVVEIFSC